MPKGKVKLYCYVDESGQDTDGRLFVVAVVIAEQQRDKLRQVLRGIERTSNKKVRSWTNTPRNVRRTYIADIISNSVFKDLVCYSLYEDTKLYVDLTILSVANAVHAKVGELKDPYEANVFVDGLKRSEQHRFAAGLRKLNVKVRKTRGLRDQSDEFIRLADSVAGFVRVA